MEATQQGAVNDRIAEILNHDTAVGAEVSEDVEQVAEQSAEAVPETEAEVQAEAEATDSDSEVDVREDVQDEQVEALEVSDFAGYLGLEADRVDVTDDGAVVFKTKVDGEDGQATLDQLIKSYQLEGHLNKENMAVQEQKKALEAKQTELDSQVSDRINQLDGLIKVAWNELNREYNAIDWQGLRQADPAEFAAKSTEFQQRQAQIQSLYQQVDGERNQGVIQDEGRMQEQLAEQQTRLLNAIPEWKDATVADKERGDIRNYAVSQGFTENEVNGIADHRYVLTLRKAMLFDRLQAEKPAVTKKVRKAPKVVKPGAAKAVQDGDAAKMKQIKKVIKSSGGKRGVADLLLASGKV